MAKPMGTLDNIPSTLTILSWILINLKVKYPNSSMWVESHAFNLYRRKFELQFSVDIDEDTRVSTDIHIHKKEIWNLLEDFFSLLSY